MKYSSFLILLIIIIATIEVSFNETVIKKPTVLIAILVRNKAAILPLFLTYLEHLNYPKSRIALWIASDNNEDESINILKIWINKVKTEYHLIETHFETSTEVNKNKTSRYHWTNQRMKNVIDLRQKAFDYSRSIWADFMWMLDCDVIITNPETLSHLISKNVTVIAPMLKSESTYSNFWAAMGSNYYYSSSPYYSKIYNRKTLGTFIVPMIHSCFLVNLHFQKSDDLSYRYYKYNTYNGPIDDIIIFAVIAQNISHVPLYLCNEKHFGFVMELMSEEDTFDLELQKIYNLKLLILNQNGALLEIDNSLKSFDSKYSRNIPNFSNEINKIFVINLERRFERKQRMLSLMQFLKINCHIFKAIDGNELHLNNLSEVKLMKDYEDPYHKRSLKMGEIGCFLSHYKIWKEIVEQNYDTVLILEDDIDFVPYFHEKFQLLLNELAIFPNWDLVYLGRKGLNMNNEEFVTNSNLLVKPKYSYWTLGYLLKHEGAVKLLSANPLSNLLPIDEFLPIMFNEHPNDTWKNYFPNRNLLVYSINPLIIFPNKYTGEDGYVSDTEDSRILVNNFDQKDEL